MRIVHGLDLSFFTGKLETYLRLKRLPYRLEALTIGRFRALARRTGVAQMPVLEEPDGRLMTDTAAIIPALEAAHAEPTLTPAEPLARMVARLLEAFADEHLWRPALFYRWWFGDDARLMGTWLAAGMLRDSPAPLWLRRGLITARQRHVYLAQDGVTRATAPAIERLFRRVTAALETALADRPFLLGDRPTLADIGFMGPYFRHFASDPTPARILRAEAPRVLAWVARLWAGGGEAWHRAQLPSGTPSGLDRLAVEIAEGFLPALVANASAVTAGARLATWLEDGATFRVPASPYRAWKLARLRGWFAELPAPDRVSLLAWLGPAAATHLAGPAPTSPAPPFPTGRPRDRLWRGPATI